MKDRICATRRALSVGLAVAVMLTGCAAIQRSEARSAEDLLAAAGFVMRPADNVVLDRIRYRLDNSRQPPLHRDRPDGPGDGFAQRDPAATRRPRPDDDHRADPYTYWPGCRVFCRWRRQSSARTSHRFGRVDVRRGGGRLVRRGLALPLIEGVVGVPVATVAYADVPTPPPAPASESPAGSGRTPTKVG